MKKKLLMTACMLCFLQAQVYVYGEDPAKQETGKVDKAKSYYGLTMYVMKNGEAVLDVPASEMYSIQFYNASPKDALIVQKNDGSLDENIALNDILTLDFSEEQLTIISLKGDKFYDYDNIAKITFGDASYTGINNPVAENGFDVIVHITPGGDVTVESPVAIKSLTLFSIDGRLISKELCADAVRKIVSLRNTNAGVYLIRVETERGAIFKKLVKSANR